MKLYIEAIIKLSPEEIVSKYMDDEYELYYIVTGSHEGDVVGALRHVEQMRNGKLPSILVSAIITLVKDVETVYDRDWGDEDIIKEKLEKDYGNKKFYEQKLNSGTYILASHYDIEKIKKHSSFKIKRITKIQVKSVLSKALKMSLRKG